VIANVGNAPLAPLVGGVRQEIGEEYDKIKESYIEIDGLPENDHLISWVWCTVGDSESVGPLKTITVTASIMIPKDTKISQLTATFEGRAKCLARNSTFLGNIGHFFGGETAELRRKDFTVHFEDSAR
jgi:hypothetical protein